METVFARTLTKKTLSEMRRNQAESDLKQSITDYCAQYGFHCRFLYESVIITTPIADWSFGYHERLKTLRHESTTKINFKTGDYAKTHEQFANRKMTCFEVIDYIAAHDQWRQKQKENSNDSSYHP